MSPSLAAGACLCSSAAFHVWLVLSLSQQPEPLPPRRPPAQVSLSLPTPAPPGAQPVTLPVTTPPPKAPAAVKHRAHRAPLAPTAAPTSTPEPTPEPPSLTGTTLVSDQGAAWTAPQGDGTSSSAPVRAGFTRTEPAPVVRISPTPSAPPEIPFARLGKPPRPPSLESALRRNYPPAAHRQGQSGEAKVRARIDPTGRVQVALLNFESAPGFGEACRRTLLDSRWSAPIDHDGRAVATWITYRCKFRVDD